MPPVQREPAPAQVLVAGEALIDVLHRADGTSEEMPGGSPANVALALGRLGRRPVLLTAIGDDQRGSSLRTWLEGSGVSVHGSTVARTSTAIARLDGDGTATYTFDITWDIDLEAVPAADVLHLGSIAAVLEPGASAISDLVDRSVGRSLVCYDPNVRPQLMGDSGSAKPRILRHIERADVVKASEEDLAWLYPGEDPVDVMRQWLTDGPALAVVTLGRNGALAMTSSFLTRVESPAVAVVDTVGAGDTFMGALIDGLIESNAVGAEADPALRRLDEASAVGILRRASRAAAIAVSRAGANPPTSEELRPAS